jgi:rare lipoprotein A
MIHPAPDLPPPRRAPRRSVRRQRAGGLLAAALVVLVALVVVLAGCASPPPRPTGPQPAPRASLPTGPPGASGAATGPARDGPGSNPPPDLDRVPDAQPRLEPVRAGGPNKPYEVLGQAYTPLAGDPPLQERGLASWYGNKFHGRGTANGETYNMYAMTAAHKTMPLPSYARVRNPANGREVVVRVNDRGPFHSDRVIDLSYTAALRLGLLGGVATVEIERITYEAIRTGAWRAPALPGADDAGAGSALATAALLPETAAWLADDAIAEIGRRAVDVPVATTYSQTARQASARSTQRQVEASERAARAAVLPPETRAPAQAAAKAAPGFWLQLGAFSQHDGAVGFQQRVAREVDWLAPLMAIFNERKLHRLQAGPYASRADAAAAADRLHEAISLVPAIVERR